MYLFNKPFPIFFSLKSSLINSSPLSLLGINLSHKTEISKEFVSLLSFPKMILTGHNTNFHSVFGVKTKLIKFTYFETVSAFQLIIEILVDELCDCEVEIISKFSIHFISFKSNSSCCPNQISILKVKDSFIFTSLLLVLILASKANVSKKLKNKIISINNFLIKKGLKNKYNFIINTLRQETVKICVFFL
ncbi:MAG: hypothetical protein LBQ24_03575 [Candidatus Peribacteria bacterium]|nr:hypothetical protein [Candidatus Peribacteria bacterium]